MPEIIVLGGGVCGLAAAMLLARDGHDVTVLERDPAPVPDSLEEACDAWERSGVAQFRQAHFMLARGREILDEELAEVRDALVALGACRFDTLGLMPPTITDRAPRPGDERYVTVTARRPVIEFAFARVAQDERTSISAAGSVSRRWSPRRSTGSRTSPASAPTPATS